MYSIPFGHGSTPTARRFSAEMNAAAVITPTRTKTVDTSGA